MHCWRASATKSRSSFRRRVVSADSKEGADSDLDKYLPEADVVITTPFHPGYISAERLSKANKLKLALTAGIGSDHVDLNAAAKNGVTVAEITGVALFQASFFLQGSAGCCRQIRCRFITCLSMLPCRYSNQQQTYSQCLSCNVHMQHLHAAQTHLHLSRPIPRAAMLKFFILNAGLIFGDNNQLCNWLTDLLVLLTGSNVVSVAEHVVMMILTLVRNYMPAHKQIINGDWNVAEIAKEYVPILHTIPLSKICLHCSASKSHPVCCHASSC